MDGLPFLAVLGVWWSGGSRRAWSCVAAPREARKGEAWCPWPESNQHSLRNSILSRARLPVPPQGPPDTGQEISQGRGSRSRRNIAAGRFRSTRADVIVACPARTVPARYHDWVRARGDECDTCSRQSVTAGHCVESRADGGARDHAGRASYAGRRLVFPAGAGYPPLSALSGAALRLLS